MIKVYLRDSQNIYHATVELDPFGPLPPNSTTTAPPALSGTEAAEWVGRGWHVLAERPVLPDPAIELAYAARTKRSVRDAKLAVTDWTASTDVTMTAEMTEYRQALRDVPAQAGFPNTIDWPVSP